MIELFQSPLGQFFAPPIVFVMFHVVLHWVSRVGSEDQWEILNFGVPLSVLAVATAFTTAAYLVKGLTPEAPAYLPHTTTDKTLAMMLVLLICFIGAVITCLLDNVIYRKHNRLPASASQRELQTWRVLNVIVPGVCGFGLFGVVARQILSQNWMVP